MASATQSRGPTPQDILDTLRLHLEPTVLLTHLPTALQLVAHITLLACAVREQAAVAEATNAKCPPHARLTRSETEVIHRCARDEDNNEAELFHLSLELRKAHIARALSTADPARVLPTAQSYFPALAESDADATTSQASSKMLFIRGMTASQRTEFRKAAAVVHKWMEAVKGGNRDALPKVDQRAMDEMGSVIVARAADVVEDATEFQAIFGGGVPDRRQSMPEPQSVKTSKTARPSEPTRLVQPQRQ